MSFLRRCKRQHAVKINRKKPSEVHGVLLWVVSISAGTGMGTWREAAALEKEHTWIWGLLLLKRLSR